MTRGRAGRSAIPGRASSSSVADSRAARHERGLPDHPQRAWDDVPVRASTPVAPDPAAGRDRAGPPRGRAGDPRLLLPARLHPRRHADPDRGDRRGGGQPVRDRLLRPGQGVPRADGPALRARRPRRRSARSTASARRSAPRSRRRAAISPSSGWSSPRWRSTIPTPTCGCRKTFVSYIVARGARTPQGGAEGAGAGHGAARARCVAPFPRISYTDAVARAQRARLRHQVGRRPRRRRRDAARRSSTTGRSSSSTTRRASRPST